MLSYIILRLDYIRYSRLPTSTSYHHLLEEITPIC